MRNKKTEINPENTEQEKKPERLLKDKPLSRVRGLRLEPIKSRKGFQIDLSIVERLGTKGFTLEQVGKYFGLSDKHFRFRVCKNNPSIPIALERGRLKRVEKVVDALYDSAIEDHNVQAQIFYLKAQAGWSDKQEIKLETAENNGLKEMTEQQLFELLAKLKGKESDGSALEGDDNEDDVEVIDSSKHE